MAIDPTIYARNLEVRLTALQQEFQKVKDRMHKAEQRLGMVDGRLFDLENDVADLVEPSASDLSQPVPQLEGELTVVPMEPKFSLKRGFASKFAVQNSMGELVTAYLPSAEAKELLAAFEAGDAVLKPHQLRKETA